jgi:iron(III) transport system permease protein
MEVATPLPRGMARPTLPRDWPAWILLALVAAAVALPIAMLVLGSVSGARLPGDIGLERLTLGNYVAVYTDPRTYRVMSNTVLYVAGSVALGLAISVALAWIVARTDLPLKWLAYAGIPLALAIPGMLEAMVWVLLFSPRIGFVNRAAMSAFGLERAPFDVYSLLGMIALEGLRLVPTGFLLLAPLFLRIDPSLEEAATVAGGRLGSVLRRVTLPLLVPGVLAVVVYQGISVLANFEVPGIIGLPGQIYVFSTLIYTYTSGTASSGGNDYGSATALAVLYLALSAVAIWIYARATARAARFSVVTGRGYRPRPIALGRARPLAAAGVLAYLGIAVVLPLLVLLWTSLTPRILQPSADALGRLTDRNWRALLANDDLVQVTLNTAFVTIVTASATVVAALAIAWVVTRTRFPGRRLLDQLSFVTHGIPGVIMALALIWIWVRVDWLPIYGTLWIIVLGFVVGFLAYGTRAASAALLQVHAELEEAAYASGASVMRTLRRVFVPLLSPALLGLWIWVALHAVRFVSLPLMLQSGVDNTVLAVYLWREWEAGEINLVAAAGFALVAAMLAVTIVVGRLGIGSRRAAMFG